MKKFILLSVLGLTTLTSSAQNENKEITSVNDIVNEQQKATTLNATERHFEDVWGRNGYFNINLTTKETMKADEEIPTGMPGENVDELTNSFGAGISLGSNIALHKRPIANIVRFNLDIQGDLNYSNYGRHNRGAFDATYLSTSEGKTYYYQPWNLAFHKLQLGLGLGPSITVAPFNTLNNEGLHYLKLNIYYHLGYQLSVIFRSYEQNDILNDPQNSFKAVNKSSYGWGLTHTFGFGLSWKTIGLGFEHSNGNARYKAWDSKMTGELNKFSQSANRLFIQLRF